MCINLVFNVNIFTSRNAFAIFVSLGSLKYLDKFVQFYIFTNYAHASLASNREVLLILERTFYRVH